VHSRSGDNLTTRPEAAGIIRQASGFPRFDEFLGPRLALPALQLDHLHMSAQSPHAVRRAASRTAISVMTTNIAGPDPVLIAEWPRTWTSLCSKRSRPARVQRPPAPAVRFRFSGGEPGLKEP
jgi:hypothetical protein